MFNKHKDSDARTWIPLKLITQFSQNYSLSAVFARVKR